MPTIRAFIAVEPDPGLRTSIARLQQDLRSALGLDADRAVRLTWVQPHAMHLTLKFLGEIDEMTVEPLRARLSAALSNWSALRLPLAQLGAYPRLDEPRVLWVGPSAVWAAGDETAKLGALQRTVDVACATFGVAKDRDEWRPHLTLARVRRGERRVGRALRAAGVAGRPVDLPPLDVAAIVMMQSELGREGPVHTPLWSIACRSG